MRILIAPDKFKGVFSAAEVAQIIAHELGEVLPTAEIEMIPMADGGEGTAEVICHALDGCWRECRVHDPLGREIDARYAWIDRNRLAVMEMSEAAGMRRLICDEPDPDCASTFGVGEMMLAAARHGAREIIVGLGGSATNDGGFGMARALGYRFMAEGRELKGRVTELKQLRRIDRSSVEMPALQIIAATDVMSPLLGKDGATRMFGPQKGVNAGSIADFESALQTLADVAAREFGADHPNEPGAGAAGGLGFGLATFAHAALRSGFEVVAKAVELEGRIARADIVITGEGSLDRQTLQGKTPAGVAQCARREGKPVYAVVGRTDGDEAAHALFNAVYPTSTIPLSGSDLIAAAPGLLRDQARQLARNIKAGAT